MRHEGWSGVHTRRIDQKLPRAQLALGVRHNTNKGLINWRGWGGQLVQRAITL
jgi:hypothetical protein